MFLYFGCLKEAIHSFPGTSSQIFMTGSLIGCSLATEFLSHAKSALRYQTSASPSQHPPEGMSNNADWITDAKDQP